MRRSFYSLIVMTLMLICEISYVSGKSAHRYNPSRLITVSTEYSNAALSFVAETPQSELSTPFYHMEYPIRENNITLEIFNSNDRGVTELYRSLSEESGYELIGTIPHDEYRYQDNDLKVRTTYYYKWRAVDGTETSPYSEPLPLTTASINYWPTFTAELINSNTILLTLTDNSMNDEVYRIDQIDGPVPIFNAEISMPDSGRTVTFNHTGVQPGETYRYEVWVVTVEDDEPTFFEVASAIVDVPGEATCEGTGKIIREIWTNIPGTSISSIPTDEPADHISELTSFETPNYTGNEYGSRIRGYVCPPMDGMYTFWISSDDASELYLSTTGFNPEDKQKIAFVNGFTQVKQWDKYPSQQSVPIHLEAGQFYYIEALHKEAGGADHLAVGWQLPNNTMQRPIPGSRLAVFNHSPVVSLTSPSNGDTFISGEPIQLTATASDAENNIQRVLLERDGNILFNDTEAPYEFNWTSAPVGVHRLNAVAFDGQNWTTSDTVTITVLPVQSCEGTGQIVQEFWRNIPGTDIDEIDFSSPPNTTKVYTSFETQQYWGNEYGSRMRAYLCPPTTGLYTFWISSDDNSRLYLVTDGNPSNKQLIASVTGATQFRQYNKYSSQQSVQIHLEAGNTYYIEALHKEAKGNDFISVGWQLPDGTMERPIPGNRLIQIESETNERPNITITSPQNNTTFPSGTSVTFTANASDSDGEIAKVEFFAIYSNNIDKIGEDTTVPYEVVWNNPTDGSYTLRATATDNSGATSNNAFIEITIGPTVSCEGTGVVYREIWRNITGTSVSSIPFNTEPDEVVPLNMLGTESFYANDYGSRIRAYLCVPITGDFRFYTVSDDNSELWLSSDEDPANISMIAHLNRAVDRNSWTQVPSQQSAPIHLIGGQKYYIEVRHKEGKGDDFVDVGWRFQNGDFEGPIPGHRLIPFEESVTLAATYIAGNEFSISKEQVDEMKLYPNPSINREVKVSIPNTSSGASAILQLISANGNVVLRREFQTHNELTEYLLQLDASTNAGIYMVNVMTGTSRYSSKLVVK